MPNKHPKSGRDHNAPKPNQTGGQGQQCKWDGNTRVTGEISVQLPKDLKTEYKAGQQESSTHNKKQRLVNWLTFVVVTIYTLVAALQAGLTRDAITKSSEQFLKDQQPYLWPDPLGSESIPVIAAGAPPFWRIRIQNFGKSPALSVKDCLVGYWGTDIPKAISAGPVDYGDPLCKTGAPASLVVPPGGQFINGPQGTESLTDAQVRIINSMPMGYIIMGKIDYQDTSGNSYQTAFCMGRLSDGIAYCGDSKDNYIKPLK